MKKKSKYLVLLILLLISIGFAYLSSTLNISGLTNIKGNNWKIYFDNIQYIRGQEFEEIAPTTNATNTKTLSYTIKLLEPGDVYKFNVDVVNDGTIDAMVRVVTDTALTEEQKKYASYYVTYSDGISVDDYQLLQNHSRDTLSIMVAYKKDIKEEDLPTEDKSITIKFHLEYEQASSSAKERNHITVVNRADNSKLSVGDELAINTEHFYVVDINNEKTTLLTKYNLYVGSIYDSSINLEKTINSSDTGYGIQNSEALGYVNDTSKIVATVPFVQPNSENVYWLNGEKLNSKYGDLWDYNDIYDSQYNSETGQNYSIAYYVKNYVNIMEQFKLKVINGRILTYPEILEFGCTTTSCNSLPVNKQFIYSTTYWLSSAHSYMNFMVDYINQDGYIKTRTYGNGAVNGVRPIIEIPALDI